MIIRLPIDTKSLYYNVLNDNLVGHTATVSSVIKQGNSLNLQLNKIFELNNRLDTELHPGLVCYLMKNSKAKVKILSIHNFNKIAVNGELIYEGEKNFCFFTKQEIDSTKKQFGRIKFHYPISLNYEDNEIVIDNRYIINLISEHLYDYAFLVNAFEVDNSNNILNFDVTILGDNKMPYSKVFINGKGVGNKMVTSFTDNIDSYDMEIIPLRKTFGPDVDPSNYLEYEKANKNLAVKLVIDELNEDPMIKDIVYASEIYPYLPYDLIYVENNVKKYLIIEQTSTNLTYFNLSYKKIGFMNCFADKSKVVLVRNINEKPVVNYFNNEDLSNMNKSFNSLMYTGENK